MSLRAMPRLIPYDFCPFYSFMVVAGRKESVGKCLGRPHHLNALSYELPVSATPKRYSLNMRGIQPRHTAD